MTVYIEYNVDFTGNGTYKDGLKFLRNNVVSMGVGVPRVRFILSYCIISYAP